MTTIADRLPPDTRANLSVVGDQPAARQTPAEHLAEVLAQARVGTGSTDPRELAIAMLSVLNQDQYVGVIGELLPAWIATQQRPAAPARHSAPPMVSGTPQPPVAHRATRPPAGRPTTADRVRSWYQQTLDRKVALDGRMVHFGACTATDLHQLATEQYRRATATNAFADQLTAVAMHMEEERLRHVGEITEATLRKLMGA